MDTSTGLIASVKRSPMVFLWVLLLLAPVAWSAGQSSFRPPAVPLVTHNPYFSVWSMADKLTDDATRHWTGTVQSLTGLARIDGKTVRIMGNESKGSLPALPQAGLELLPTRTIYRFAGEGVRLTLTFLTPALPQELDVLSRPATYLVWQVQSADGREHEVSLYFDASKELVVNTPEERVQWGRYKLGDAEVLRMGSEQQPILQKSGDNLRIDWGYLYLAAAPGNGIHEAATDRREAVHSFESNGRVPNSDDLRTDGPGRSRMPVLAYSANLGKVGSAVVSRHLVLAYDDLYSVEYFHRRLRPYWRRNNEQASDMLLAALRDYDSLATRCERFDSELMADMRRAGGEEYARLGALAYRQTLAAHGLTVDIDGKPMMFPKENFSNGCIGTVDVIYPSSPFFLLFNPRLLEAQLRPVMEYAELPRWKFPFAPHDLGTYPLANGQVYGGGEKTEDRQMPVEESGNMLLMTAALTRVEGNAAFAERYWPLLRKWAEYLKANGMDPANQLSTDDFAGHLAHNANLSVKAILALRAYGMLCQMTGKTQEAEAYRRTSEEFAKRWVQMAAEGDRYRLAFDKPGTWSQKYNLIWNKVLDFHLFPPEVARKEIAFYKTRLNRFGLPLDNRKDYTKLDWELWTASLADSSADFRTLLEPVYRFVDESPSRVPLTDWYGTVNGLQQHFQARSVVGGVFIKMLTEPALWKKWAGAAHVR